MVVSRCMLRLNSDRRVLNEVLSGYHTSEIDKAPSGKHQMEQGSIQKCLTEDTTLQ